ncbi:RHS repeat-associated core domain-containing protein [Opitutus sp. ER46]|uniref:RHS repeat-associated core domain-containing protein n=1 Tax=Opitutus sp. ER46 TaxID=2161864 RepID=UPI001E2E8F7E|nr:RHS repeat-associated core domain-containing protein [Opitutus sp. ER46]
MSVPFSSSIAEVNASDALQRTYVWGLDLASSLNATGGIGALVQMVDHTGTATAYLPAYDGGGNVAALMSSDGNPAAVYEYGPFGERMRAEGTYATTNPFRHATKFTDEESGLVYYGRRYYSPSLGRFISRDPIGAAGGPNLYGFVANDPVNRSDYLGMAQDDPPSDPGPNVYRRPPYDELGNTDYGVYGPGEPPPLGPSAPVAPNKGVQNKADCDKLRARLRQAQQIGAVNAARVLPGGMYSGGIALSSDDATSLSAGLIGALAAGAVQFYETRPVVNGPNGMQYLTNGGQAAEMFRTTGYVVGGISLVVDGKAMVTANNGTDRAFAGANLATDAFLLGGKGAITAWTGSAPSWLGPWGIALAGAQFSINAGTAYKLSADANEILRDNAKAAMETASRANATAADIQKQMTDGGCAP